jgi:hypothetical protein
MCHLDNSGDGEKSGAVGKEKSLQCSIEMQPVVVHGARIVGRWAEAPAQLGGSPKLLGASSPGIHVPSQARWNQNVIISEVDVYGTSERSTAIPQKMYLHVGGRERLSDGWFPMEKQAPSDQKQADSVPQSA